jgi:hypothetical protein
VPFNDHADPRLRNALLTPSKVDLRKTQAPRWSANFDRSENLGHF